MIKSKLYNPFINIAGLKSLLIGICVMLTTSAIAYFTGTHYNGLLNINYAKDSGYIFFFIENFAGWICTSIFLYISGLILSLSKIRAIDVFGTTAFSRIPLILVPTIRLLPYFESFTINSFQMIFLSVIYIFTMVWTLILLFNAFKISCNLKNEKLIISFIISIVLAEISTKSIIYLTN